MRRAMLCVLAVLGLSSAGCTREAAAIGFFAAAAAASGAMMVAEHCAQEGVDCSPEQSKRHIREKHDDPYSTAVDW